MAKSIEQIMEEQMAQMMAQMLTSQQTSQQASQTNNRDDNWKDESDNRSNTAESWNDEQSVHTDNVQDENPIKTEQLTSGSYSSQFGDEDPIVVQTSNNIAKKFAYENYNSVGEYLVDSTTFYSITDIDSFSSGFESYAEGATDSLLPLLIKYANSILKKSLSTNDDNSKDNSFQSQVVTSLNDQILNLTKKLEELKGKIRGEKEFFNSQDMQFARTKARESVMNNSQPFESLVSEPRHATFMGNTFEYQQYTQEKDFGFVFNEGSTPEETCKNLRSITRFIAEDIASLVGGFNRITDLMIISDIIVVNGVSYEPILPLDFINHLPLDVQNSAKAGHFAWLFDFSYLREMHSLTNLSFDSTDFVFKKVRIDLNLKRDFEPKNLFNVCKRLMNLQIGTYQFTRNNMDAYDDVFHKARRSTEIADAIESWGVKTTKNRWVSIKDYYNNSEKRGLWKAGGLVARTGVAIGVSAGTLGFKATRFGGKVAKSVANGISSVIQAAKEEL